jgi:hypothetical protein
MVYKGFVEAPEADAKPTTGTAINSRALDATAATVLFKRNFISSSSSTVFLNPLRIFSIPSQRRHLKATETVVTNLVCREQ